MWRAISDLLFGFVPPQSQETKKQSGDTGRTGPSTQFIKNPTTLDPILLYHGSKCKQTKQKNSSAFLWALFLTILCDHYKFFSFFPFQNANMPGSNCVIKCGNSFKKKKALFQEQSRGPNQLIIKFFFISKPRAAYITNWEETLNYCRASQLCGVLVFMFCGFMIVFLKHHENTSS